MKSRLWVVVSAMLLLLSISVPACAPSESIGLGDMYLQNVYPGATNTYDVGSLTYQWDDGYFQNVYVGGVALGGGGLEIDPVFTASPAGTITLLDINAWDDHPALTTGTHGVAGTIVGTSDAQTLTNKNITMDNNVPLQWEDGTATAREIFNFFNWLDIMPGLNYDAIWWLSSGTGRTMYLWGTTATAISTTKSAPTISLLAAYWDGVSHNWEAEIVHSMVTAGAAPKSRLGFTINALPVIRLENDNGTVKTYSDGMLDMTGHSVSDVYKLNFTDPTELTINAGAVTVTQSFHTVDTQGDAATDYLDTINGGAIGDILHLSGANDAREVIITRNGNIRFQPEHMIEVFSFASPAGASGTFYSGGYYYAPAADANLTQASTTVTWGTANAPYGSRSFVVAANAGTTDAGTVSIVVSGTSITSAGVRTPGDSEIVVANITTMAANSYYQTTKKWLGTITYTLTGAGGATTYAADFNYGLAAYDSFDERGHTIKLIEIMGRAGANDTGFNIELLHHKSTGWTYSAAAFVPGTAAVASLVTDYATDNDLVTNERFKWEHELATAVAGTTGEGFLVRVTTTANKAVEFMDISIYAEVVPNDQHLKSTSQAVQLIFNGTNWMLE